MPFAAAFTFAAVVALLACAAAACLAVVTIALRRGGRREDPLHDSALATSRFVLPVSVVVPVSGPCAALPETVSSLLALDYPQLEVIVIGDETDSAALRHLCEQWALSPREYFYRRAIDTASARRILATPLDPRLKVIHKPERGRADALNCGVNLARYRYVASVAPDVVLDPDALLRLMAPALRDPAGVAAATAIVERRGAAWAADPGILGRAYRRVLGDWQWIGSLRGWLAGRIVTSRLRWSLAPQDTVVIWRRDWCVESGGFSRDAVEPELELLLRLQLGAERRGTGTVIRTGDFVGRTCASGVITAADRARRRGHALVAASVQLARGDGWRHARVGAWCLILAEQVAPVVQVLIVLAIAAGAVAGWFSWPVVARVIVMLAFGNGAITAAALLMRGAAPGAPTFAEALRLLALAPAEYVIYRPAIAVSRLYYRS